MSFYTFMISNDNFAHSHLHFMPFFPLCLFIGEKREWMLHMKETDKLGCLDGGLHSLLQWGWFWKLYRAFSQLCDIS